MAFDISSAYSIVQTPGGQKYFQQGGTYYMPFAPYTTVSALPAYGAAQFATMTPLSAAQIASPDAGILADKTTTYYLNTAPYTRYQSNGSALTGIGGVSTDIALADLADQATNTVVGNISGGSAAPTAMTLAALESALSSVRVSGGGQVRIYKLNAAPSTVPISTTRGVSARITIPGGVLGANGIAWWWYVAKKTGTADTPSFQVHVMAAGGTPGSSDFVSSGVGISSTNERAQAWGVVQGNRTDQSSLVFVHPLNVPDPTGASVPSTGHGTRTVNTASSWDFIFTATTSTTDTAETVNAMVAVFNPDAATGDVGTSREITGAATLIASDVNAVIRFNSASTAVITIPSDTTLGIVTYGTQSITVYVAGAGVPTFAGSGATINGSPRSGIAQDQFITLVQAGAANTWAYA